MLSCFKRRRRECFNVFMIIGHQNIISFFDKALAGGRLGHAYIFHGPKNVGKTTVAENVISKILNTDSAKLHLHPDFFRVVSDGTISKEQIDELTEKIRYTAFGGGYKIALLEDAHTMTISASNAFLKTLEEPSQKSVIILLVSDVSKLPPTIISRSAMVRFNRLSSDEMAYFLRERGVGDVRALSNVSYGRPGRAMKLLENSDWQRASRSAIGEFCNLFFGHPADRFSASVNIFGAKTASGKETLFKRIDFWLELLRDMIFIKYGLNDMVAHSYESAVLERVAANRPVQHFSALAGRLIKMRGLLGQNINPQIMLENLII